MKTFIAVVVCALVSFFAGCATPERRISQNPEAFSKLSPGDQQLIREGKIAVGFTEEMVKLALGDPDKVYTRTDENGDSIAWSYTTYETDTGVILYRGFYHRYWCDPFYYPYYTSFGNRRDHEYLKVVFKDGRVSVIERQT